VLTGGNAEMDNSADPGDLISRLFAAQQLGVLSTQSEGQPYSNLVAFAAAEDLKSLVFVTNRNTSKYANVISNPKVAMMVDSRTNEPSDFNSAVAVTILGTATEVAGNERDRLVEVYIAKHPHLADFVNRPSQALIRVNASDFIIASFDSVQVVHVGD
jgi:nitroimidazol reductase NimA-like FMN-containing flavoprotein (pyridoxamine 5'-phosphate oxidase superfamily)